MMNEAEFVEYIPSDEHYFGSDINGHQERKTSAEKVQSYRVAKDPKDAAICRPRSCLANRLEAK